MHSVMAVNDSGILMIVKPQFKKSFLQDILLIVFFAVIFLLILYILNLVYGTETIVASLQSIGILLDETGLIFVTLLSLFLVTFIILMYDAGTLYTFQYTFHPSFFIYQKNIALFLNNRFTIPYGSIAKISYSEGGLLDKVFSTGTIILEVHDPQPKEIMLRSIENPEQIAQEIHSLITSYLSRQKQAHSA